MSDVSPVTRTLDFGSDGSNDGEDGEDGIDNDSYVEYSEDARPSLAARRLRQIEDLQRISAELEAKAQAARVDNTRILLGRIMKTPFERNRKQFLVKYFLRWSKMLPLHVKCDELARQLQDRLVAIASIRDSYLRDVVRVKYHLQKIQEFKLPGDDQPALIKQTGHDMYDLHVVPSISLRKLIDRATEVNTSSMQLQETLIQAGLVNVSTGKAYNAWEKSKNFPKIMKHNRGPDFKIPKTNGESISCSTPQTHELFVRYCKECTGIMQFVRAWNFEVEDSLRFKAEGQRMQVVISNLEVTINRLNDIIHDQEKAVVEKDAFIEQLLQSGKFMDQWTYQQEMKDREATYQQDIKNLRNERGMASADKESTEIELQLRRKEDNRVWKLKDTRMKYEVAKIEEDMNEEKRQRLEMLALLTSSQTHVVVQDKIISDLSSQVAQQKALIGNLREQLAKTETEKNRFEEMLNNVSFELDSLRVRSTEEIQSLQSEVTVLTRDNEDKDRQINNLYDQKREVLEEKESVFEELEMLRIELARRQKIDREAAEAARRLAMRPKYSMKVVAMVVRMCVRIARGVERARNFDYSYLGSTVYHRLEINNNSSHLSALRAELAAMTLQRDELLSSNKNLTVNLERQRAMTTQQREQLVNERDRVRDLNADLTNKVKTIAEMEKYRAEMNLRDQRRVVKINELAKLLRRAQRFENLQRSQLLRYAQTVTRLNRMMYAIGPDVELSIESIRPFISQQKRQSVMMIEQEAKAKELGVEVQPIKMSALRREELTEKLYRGVEKLVKYGRTIAPLQPALEFTKPSAYVEAMPLTDVSTNFVQKLAWSSKAWVERYRKETESAQKHCEAALFTARAAFRTASRDRSKIMELYIIVDEHADNIAKLTNTIALMEGKEIARLADLEKKEKKAEAKRIQRETKLRAVSSVRLTNIGGRRTAVSAPNDPVSPSSSVEGLPDAEHVAHGGDLKPKLKVLTRMPSAPEQGGGWTGGSSAKRPEFDISVLDEPKKKTKSDKAPSAALIALASRPQSDHDGSSTNSASDEEESEVDPNEAIMDSMMTRIGEQEEELANLYAGIEEAHKTIQDWEAKEAIYREEKSRSAAQIATATVEYEAAIGRIRVLRQAVEDNYRERQRMLEELRKEQAEKEQKEEKARMAAKRNKGTYIACSVCAIRAHGLDDGEDCQGGSSQSTQPMVHEHLADVLQGEVVLMARPRAINRHHKRTDYEPKVDIPDASRIADSAVDIAARWEQTLPHNRQQQLQNVAASLEPHAIVQSHISGTLKDSKFRIIRSMPQPQEQSQRIAADSHGHVKKSLKHAGVVNKGLPLNKNSVEGRTEVQTSAYMQYNTLARYGLGEARPKSSTGTLEIAHRPLHGVPVRSLSASAMMLQLGKQQMQKDTHLNSAIKQSWRLDDGSFDLGVLQAEMNGGEDMSAPEIGRL
jgi:hypothetical protein